MLRLLYCEYIKLKRSKFLLIGLTGTLVVPLFVIVRAVTKWVSQPGASISLFSLYDDAFMLLMLLFGPLVLTILGAWTIGREYADRTLKNILVIPISQTVFLAGKLLFFAILALLFMLITWLEILVLALLCSCILPVTELTISSVLFFLMRMLYGGILLYAVQTPFLYLTVRTKGFMVPLIAAAVVILINVVLSNSPIAGFYPWSAVYFLVCGHTAGLSCPKEISLFIILAIGLLGSVASLAGFQGEVV